jgi:Zn-dependent protease
MSIGGKYQKKIEKAVQPTVAQLRRNVRPSPLFGLVLIVFGASCMWAFKAGDELTDPLASWPIRAMVLSGWVLSLCFHEFGHAAVAFMGGDRTVVGKGYLSLDPTKYTDGIRSVLVPIVFLLMGGIGLPGGAVYIQTGLIRSPRWRSFMSLAGPAANLMFGALCSTPFLVLGRPHSHVIFLAALAYLGTLQFFAALLNLLPIPGLDGFGAISPYLTERNQVKARELGQYSMFLLFLIVFRVPGFSQMLWNTSHHLADLFHIPVRLSVIGQGLFSFR